MVTNEQWLSENHPIQKPRLMVKDTDGSEWIVLTCYDGYRLDAEEGTVKDLFLFSNAAFIKYKELEIFGDGLLCRISMDDGCLNAGMVA